MKALFLASVIFGAVSVCVGSLQASDVGVSINLNFGGRVDDSVPQVIFAEPPVFLALPGMGFYAAVEIPHDIFFVSFRYYLLRHGSWYVSSRYDGPWSRIEYRRIPRGLRKYRYEDIVIRRNKEQREYRNNRAQYRGKWHQPKKRLKNEKVKPVVKEGREHQGQGKKKGGK